MPKNIYNYTQNYRKRYGYFQSLKKYCLYRKSRTKSSSTLTVYWKNGISGNFDFKDNIQVYRFTEKTSVLILFFVLVPPNILTGKNGIFLNRYFLSFIDLNTISKISSLHQTLYPNFISQNTNSTNPNITNRVQVY